MTSAIDLQLKAALTGNFDAELEAGKRLHSASARGAVYGEALAFQAKVRLDMAQSGLVKANQLAKTWRLKKYPSKHGNDAALVYSTWPLVVAGFEADKTIRSGKGFYLLIPNPEVWPTGRVVKRSRRGMTENELEIAERRFGRLQFVYRKTGLSLLVADVRNSRSRPGRYKHASATALKTGRGLVTVVVFFLAKVARQRRRLHSGTLRERERRDAPQNIARRYVRLFETGDMAPPRVIKTAQ